MGLNKNGKTLSWSLAATIGTIGLFFAACGDDVINVTEVTEVVGMQVVEKGKTLPKCTADNEGRMVYSVDSATAFSCIDEKWISMKGKDGADGKDGVDGKNGKDGNDGVDGKNGKDGADGKNGKDGKNGTNGINGNNGTNGSNGTSCTAVAIDNGYKIVCGSDSVGVVLNGTKGDDGKSAYELSGSSLSQNEWLESLKSESCSLVENEDGTVTIGCGDESSTTLYKAVCNQIPYDPMKQYCSVKGIFDLEECGDKLYNPEIHFCDTRDSNLYRYVRIGLQTWMADNLNYKTENSWCGIGYKETEGDCSKHGRVYTFAATVGKSEEDCGDGVTCGLSGRVYGVCPSGWYLPDTAAWNKLFSEVGGFTVASRKLRTTYGWDGSYKGTDAFGFSAYPIAIESLHGDLTNNGYNTFFWTSTEEARGNAYYVGLSFLDNAYMNYDYKYYAFSVRCYKKY